MRGLLLAASAVSTAHACTAYAAGKHATIEGSVIVSHSDDAAGDADGRISFVPAANHKVGMKRPVFPDTEAWPGYVGSARGSTYAALLNQEETKPIGWLPEAAHTYAYYDGNYAVQNECQLMFGESTASSVFSAFAIGTPGGTALLSVNELSRLAAERTCTAREAVVLMGSLAEAHGFYGADGGAGEVLTVGDKEESFVFHIISDPKGKGAIWVAQRVPDSHIAVVANMFTIREVDLSDSHTFLGSGNMHAVAKEYALWDGKGLLDFTRAFSGGEYLSKYYSGRRMWDGYRRFKPSLKLPEEYGSLRYDDVADNPWGRSVYPFSVEVDRKLSTADIFAAHRSHYEGTKFVRPRSRSARSGTSGLHHLAASHASLCSPRGRRIETRHRRT